MNYKIIPAEELPAFYESSFILGENGFICQILVNDTPQRVRNADLLVIGSDPCTCYFVTAAENEATCKELIKEARSRSAEWQRTLLVAAIPEASPRNEAPNAPAPLECSCES